jgi:PAS domain S-box-containing protein
MIGELTDKLYQSLMETIPVEFSVLDADDTVVAWNKDDSRIFKRPSAALGRNVRDCHPKKSLDKVEQIIKEMKDGSRDKARFWIDLPIGPDETMQKVLIEYYALRDPSGTYLGCLEASQNISDIQEIKGQKRLLD